MEIVAALPRNTTGASGGTKKHVEEWSRQDHLTGRLEHARVEADHWASNTSNTRHHFGKVVDSRARNLADGSVQQQKQTKQLEVFQAHIPGRSIQVIRSHTSTSSSWHNSKVLQSKSSHMDWPSSADKFLQRPSITNFSVDDLKLQSSTVNLESGKTKANIARLLPARRPPTRSKLARSSDDEFFKELPKLCDEAQSEIEKRLNSFAQDLKFSLNDRIELSPPFTNGISNFQSDHLKLEKKISISDENLNITEEKLNSELWKRDSKARWSLQVPKTKFRSLESKNDLEFVLQKVLQHRGERVEPGVPEKNVKLPSSPAAPWKKKSFVSEQTLKEMKQKLRPVNGDECKIEIIRDEEPDDGICTESKGSSDKEDEKAEELPVFHENNEIVTTRSLESRSKHKSEDWFDRRKSYGFEPVCSSTKNVTMKVSNLSTDSGICRSSELELSSTPIVKKLADENDKRIRKSIDLDESSDIGKVVVSELRSQFEKKSTEVKTNLNESNFAIRPGKVQELIKTLRQTGSSSSFESKSSKNIVVGSRSKAKDVDEDPILKRHSIACDDLKYIFKFSLEESKSSPNSKTTLVNVNNFKCENVPTPTPTNISPSDSADIKRPKKVEFSKTEVHFAAAEPGKIKIVETNEKPPPANRHRRRKLSQSASPKIGLPETKFGDEKSFESRIENCEESVPAMEPEVKDSYCGHGLTSTTSDNGLAVRILSTKSNDSRRASWSDFENNENKSGYSTKVNFGDEGVIVVADANQFESLETDTNASDDLDVNNGGKFKKKLIVRIGGSGGSAQSRTTAVEYSHSRFTSSFRNSIQTQTRPSSSRKEINLKSTSLIIDTMKRSMNAPKSQYDDLLKKEKRPQNLEQPSTYLMEMNKLQQRYRHKQNKSVDQPALLKDENQKSRIYNTIPAGKNGLRKPKTIINDLPSVLSAFDTLYQSIDQAIEENRTTMKCRNRDKLVQHTSSKFKKYSSQSWFLEQFIPSHNDENLSDDSLKADEEVRSYMSTAVMEEYENELSGSWSRRRHRKNAKPNEAKEAEISEKSHFKPLRSISEEEKLKTVMNVTNVDIKKPKITSVAVNSTPPASMFNEDKTVNSTTVLLNNGASLINETVNLRTTNEPSATHNIYENTKNNAFKIATSVKNILKPEPDSKNVKVIHHQLQLPEKHLLDLPRKDESKSKPRKIADNSFVSSGSFRKKSTNDRGKLFDSGRDSWLNLPKERKPVANDKKMYGDCTKLVPRQMKNLEGPSRRERESTISKAVAEQLNINGFTDVSSEEDTCKRSYKKPFSKPLTTISEKTSLRIDPKIDTNTRMANCKIPLMKTTLNSSLESHSNSFEFRTPVLKTEERSKRRAARMMHRASSREALINAKSSSEDITSENEAYFLRSNKIKSPRKNKLKISKAEHTLLSNPSYNRLIQQKSAKMEINIFDFKDKRNGKTVTSNVSSRSLHPQSNIVTLGKTRYQGSKDSQKTSRSSRRPIILRSKAVRTVAK